MRENKGTSTAVLFSAVLHLGIVGFLALAIVPCSFYESLFSALHLPASWNPITCAAPLELQGPVIEATLIGSTGAPPPKPVKAKPLPDTTPPLPTVPPPTPPPVTPPDIKTLPPPPEHPDLVDQEKVVADALQKAEDAKKEQEEKQRQRQAELDAQAARKKEEQKKQLDELFAKMDAAANARQKAENKAKQAKQQMEDLKNAQEDGQADLPRAPQRQTGNNAQNTTLTAQYKAAIQNAVTPNWLRPDNMPDVPCVVNIVQLPGGDVVSAQVEPGCPYDEAGKQSLENAILRTKTLPYKGFEKVFSREIKMSFRPQ